MNSRGLQDRTKCFALDVIELTKHFPSNRQSNIISNQILRSSTSVASNYRAVCRARSDKEFISKLEIVIEEADETLFWLELIEEAMILPLDYNISFKTFISNNRMVSVGLLKKEANELISIFVASSKTIKARLNQHKC